MEEPKPTSEVPAAEAPEAQSTTTYKWTSY